MTTLASTPATPAAATTTTVSASSLIAATRATPEIKTQDLQQAVDFYQKGIELAHNATSGDDFVRAIELYSIAIAIRADQPRFFFARGNAFRAVNELEFAARDYGLAISLDDRTAAYFANRGACYRKLNQPIKALEDLTAAVDMDSKKANHYFNRALVLHDHGFFKEATIDLTRTLDEGSAGIRVEYKALQLRGNCYRKLGNLHKCIDDLQRAIQLDGRNSTGFSSLAQAFLDAGDLDHAIEHFSNAIQFNNTQASYYALRGLCYYRKCKGGRGAAADGATATASSQNARMCLADFNQSIKLDGKDPQAYFYRGSIRLALALDLMSSNGAARSQQATQVVTTGSSMEPTGGGTAVGLSITASLTAEEQLEASFADIEMAWSLSPTGLKFQIGMAMITQLKQQYERASSLFRDVQASDRASVVVKYHWALCCHMLGDYVTSLTLLCDCIDVVPTEPLFFEARGLVLQEAGHYETAMADFTEAIALRAQAGGDASNINAWNLYLRAECQLRLSRFQDTVHDATLVLEPSSSPSPQTLQPVLETSVRNARAMAYRGLGEYDGAIGDLSVCLRLDPKNDVFSYHRALCLLECERFREALPDLHAVVSASDANRDDAYILYSIGLCYYHERQPSECIEYMERAKCAIDKSTSAPESQQKHLEILPDLHYRMGVAHAQEGLYIRAIEHFTYAIDAASLAEGAGPESPSTSVDALRYVHERAKALQMERYHEESIEDFNFVIAHNPNNAHAYFRRGFAFKALGQLKAAAADFESAKLLDPKNPRLVIKYKELKDTECIVLCAPGEEPAF